MSSNENDNGNGDEGNEGEVLSVELSFLRRRHSVTKELLKLYTAFGLKRSCLRENYMIDKSNVDFLKSTWIMLKHCLTLKAVRKTILMFDD